MEELKQLDKRIVGVMEIGDIRLLRREWLMSRPAGFRMQRRQQLEALEISVSNATSPQMSPLLSPAEASELLQRGERAIGVLSYGWLSDGDPDPMGTRLQVVLRALEVQPHIMAVFWDFASLHQKPRVAEEDAAFGRALDVMGDIYASAVGTTVLQLKEIPERPAEFEGLLTCNQLQEPANTTDATLAEMITLMLAPYGQVQSCDLSTDEPRNALVRFASHMEAAAAQARASHAHLCAWIALKYNERPYDERGWCIFEDAVSSELVVQCRT